MHHEARQEAGARKEIIGLLDVAIDEDVLPGHQHLVHDEHGVVLVDPARQRIVEGRTHHRRLHFVRRAADELHARRIGRHHEDGGEFLVLHRDQAVMRDEGVIGQHRAGRHHLGARDDDALVGFLFDVTADVADFVRRLVAIDRRMDDGVIDEGHALLAEFVPAFGVVLIRIVEIRIGAERRQKRRLVVGRAAEPAISELGPFRDRGAAGEQVVHRLGRLEESMRHAAIAGVGRHHDFVFVLGVVHGVVQPRHHPRGVAEGRMFGDLLDLLAVDEDLAAVVERGEILRSVLRTGDFDLAGGFGLGCEGFGARAF